MDLNLISVVHTSRNTKKRKIAIPTILLLLITISTLVFHLIADSISHNHVSSPFAKPIIVDKSHAQVVELSQTHNPIDSCDVLQKELKIFGKVIDTASVMLLFHQLTTGKLLVFSTDPSIKSVEETKGVIHQIDYKNFVINWRGCDFVFSY